MVGDAANDLTAIASADIGIAVKSKIGDTLTEQHAGMVVQQGLLFPIATAFDVASKTKQNIFQNLFVSLTYNSVITLVVAGLFVALGFALNPAIGVALMVVESTIVLANLYRLKHQETVSLASNIDNNNEIDPTEETTSQIGKGLGFSLRAPLEPEASPTESRLRPSFCSAFSRYQLQFFGDSNKSRDYDHPIRQECLSI